MKKIIFFDTETTGIGEEDYLCQIAYKTGDEIFQGIYKPPIPIPPGASAVHHISNQMVEDRPAFVNSDDFNIIKKMFEDTNSTLVAHNMPFDLGMIKKEGIVPVQTICTLRVARHLDKDGKLAKHNLQFLRYALGIEIDAKAHEAMGDVLVLEQLYLRLLKKIMTEENVDEASAIEKMVEISAKPSLMRSFSFGKHSGKKVEDVAQEDRGYLEWLLAQKEQSDKNDEDWIYTLRHYLGK
ncbi:MAG: exonuclease domain-containing protein [Patescibacteria group bacterium]